MKKCSLLLLVCISFLFQNAWSQEKGQHALTYKVFGVDNHSPYAGIDGDFRTFKFDRKNAFDQMTMGAGIEYYYGFKDWLAVGVPFKMGVVDVHNSYAPTLNRKHFFDLEGRVKLSLSFLEKQILIPYISTGVAGVYRAYGGDQDPWDLEFPVELGLSVRVTPRLFLNASTEYRASYDEMKDTDVQSFTNSMHHAGGITIVFGKDNTEEEPEPVIEEPKPLDTDGDGIIDTEDACPEVAGLAALSGCPDADGDGVTDAEDKCPELAGTKALSGCPDTDGDGITDAEDKCPELAGIKAFNGCPDTDGDGLADNEDKCPTEKGTKANNGCPVRVVDRDNDGIEDSKDNCPSQPGLARFNGCPDTDGDGIADKNDNCPSQPGLARFNGCPDKDNDGVQDRYDRCPNVAGSSANSGCPQIKQEDKKVLEFAKQAIEFETGSAVIRTTSYPILDQVAGIMAKYPAYSMTISGYTDSVGNDANNLKLSEKRAKACFDYLVRKGVSGSRMSSAGYGEASPIGDNGTREGRQQNRRVEFDIFLK